MPYFDSTKDIYTPQKEHFKVHLAGNRGPRILLLHGGGYTAQTWSLTVELLKPHCQVIAPDLRNHGQSKARGAMSIQVLIQDVICILQNTVQEEEPIIIVGHSMGGAIGIHVAHYMETHSKLNVQGIVVMDVVEGSAMEALPHMDVIIAKRPKKFTSIDEGIQWGIATGIVKCERAARISMPSQLELRDDGNYYWITDLKSTAAHWKEWFTGISNLFLELHVATLLMIAGTDRLDTALTRAQMEGKFQLVLTYGTGHVIQEDDAPKTANTILEFTARYVALPTYSNTVETLEAKLAKARAMIPRC